MNNNDNAENSIVAEKGIAMKFQGNLTRKNKTNRIIFDNSLQALSHFSPKYFYH